ncbi:MAG: SDR family oxidoreductase [Microbacteriaceae bacterium]|nr:SDR family oxidoreductase [Microbacteriaceae bacterium]
MPSEITSDLPLRRGDGGLPALCLVTGATGYIGGRLVRELLAHGYRVRVMARHAERLRFHPWIDKVEVVDGDATNREDLKRAVEGVDVAYYLLHALMSPQNFEEEERLVATLFSEECLAAGVSRIVYLGGMADADSTLSPHLQSRADTGDILQNSGVPTIELRAGVVIGSGSASFEMLRYLTERLPIMTVPKWVNSRIQPIAVRDVLRYLVGAAGLPKSVTGDYDIGGPDVFTYREMMEHYAAAAGLRPRIIIPVPVLTPRLSSGWVGLVTPVPYTLARRLVASLKNEVVARNDDIRRLIPDPPAGLTTFDRAVTLALSKIKDAHVDTRWSDASLPGAPSEPLPTDPKWAGGTLYQDIRIAHSTDSVDEVWKRIESIGGDNGYSTASWAWEVRGLLDRLVGGPGLRRGRRDPNHLVEGEALDFWRVESLRPPNVLRLRAEMRNPGLAWLEFTVAPDGTGAKVTQRAFFAPRGLAGHVYWWLVWPMHGLVFPSMVNSVARGRKNKRS